MTDLLKWLLSPNSLLFSSVPTLFMVLLAAALVIYSPGLFRPAWFRSAGYGYTAAALMFFPALVWDGPFWGRMTALALLVHGLRLGTYLWLREFRPGFRSQREDTSLDRLGRSAAGRLALWLGGSGAGVLMASPVVFHLHGGIPGDGGWLSAAGLWISLLGLVIRTSADHQRARFKKIHPDQFCSGGLFRLVRFPHCLGEILVWTGAWAGALPFLQADPWRWGLAASGLILLILFILGSAYRLEAGQAGRYGLNRAFQAYCRSTPVLLPLVPWRTLKNLKFYIG